MAYADRMTMGISPCAQQWYDAVRDRVLKKCMGQAADMRAMNLKNLEELFRNHESSVLDGFSAKGYQPMVSSDDFHWNVARATWKAIESRKPCPFEHKKPETYGIPCSEQYVRHWHIRVMTEKHLSGNRRTVGSSSEMTPVEVRDILAQRVRPKPVVPARGCEPLAFPVPTVRQPELCLGPRDDIQKTMVEAAKILGPEFTLSCSYGGNEAAIVTLGLAPGVDANDERVLSRARDPVDWLEDWWVNVLERDTNLLAHLQLLMRQRFTRPHEDMAGRVAAAMESIAYNEEKGAKMTESDVVKAQRAQQRELDNWAEGFASLSISEESGWENRGRALGDFVDKGHRMVRVLNREDRLRVVQRRLARDNAVVVIASLISYLMEQKRTAEAFKSILESFIRSGAKMAPYVDGVSDRISVVEQVWSKVGQTADMELKLAVRNLLFHWQDKLAKEAGNISEAGERSLAASMAASTRQSGSGASTVRPGAAASAQTVRTVQTISSTASRAPSGRAPSGRAPSVASVAGSVASSGDMDHLGMLFEDLLQVDYARPSRSGTQSLAGRPARSDTSWRAPAPARSTGHGIDPNDSDTW